MSSVLLFCVAPVALSTISDLMSAPKDNFYHLVQSTSVEAFNRDATDPPDMEFESGFLGHSSEQIRHFVTTHLGNTPQGTNLSPGFYALLDHESDRTKSVVFGAHFGPEWEIDVDDLTEEEHEASLEQDDEADPEPTAWMEWRVSFADADKFFTLLTFESDTTVKLYNERFVEKYTDTDGVFHAQEAVDEYAKHLI